MHLGRHRAIRHGVTTRVSRTVTTVPDKPPATPLPVSDPIGRAQAAAKALVEAMQDLATDYRLVREENTKLRETLTLMEQSFSVLKGRR